MAVNINGSYGVNKELRAESKLGWVTFKWLASLIVCELPTILKASSFPHSQFLQMIMYMCLNLIFSFYMVSRPSTNPGKLMWEIIYASLAVHHVRYLPIDYYIR